MPTYYGTNRRDIFDGGAADERVYGLAGDDDLYGNGGRDELYGDNGWDLLVGGSGDDRLFGGAGSDLLDGGQGDDLLNGGSGFDYADYQFAASRVVVNLSTGTATDDGDGGRDRLRAIEGVYGSRFGDRLTGDKGTNELFGEDGNDWLTGGGGQDLTVGGFGADRFIFADGDTSSNLDRADLIGDFRRNEGDRIDLHGIDANTAEAGDQAFAFVGSAAFSGRAGELRFTHLNGETLLLGDTNGDAAADLYIRMSDTQTLVQGDFML